MPSYVSTYLVTDREIAVTVNGAATLAEVAGTKSYMSIKQPNGVMFVIDLSLYLLFQKALVLTTTLSALAASLTDLQIASYTATDIPNMDVDTDGYADRINVYDANAAIDVQVSWTSVVNPTVRNDIYQRAELNDLVLSSATRDFENCMVAVNGVFHRTYFYNKELYVQGGYFNIKNTKRTLISVYDTASIGGHDIYPIRPMNIDASNANPFSGVTLTFPEIDFSNSTVLLVIGGYIHVMDGTYRVLNTNRLLIETCKIDLINQFLHNPNTIYTKDSVTKNILEPVWNPSHTVTRPSPVEDIYYFLANYPQNNPNRDAALTTYEWQAEQMPHKPTTREAIMYYLETYADRAIETTDFMLADYQWITEYERLVRVIQSIPMWKFQDPRFVYETLLLPNTFVIVLKNANLYKRTYPLTRTEIAAQYIHHGKDTPRGTLLYNDSDAIPYLLYSEAERRNHNFSLGYAKTATDAYKTTLNPPAIPSPLYDVHDPYLNYPAQLLELYAAT